MREKLDQRDDLWREEIFGVRASACEDGDLMFYLPQDALAKHDIRPTSKSCVKWAVRLTQQRGNASRERTILFEQVPAQRTKVRRIVSLQDPDKKRLCVIQVQSQTIGKFKKLTVCDVRAWVHTMDGSLEIMLPFGLTLRNGYVVVPLEATQQLEQARRNAPPVDNLKQERLAIASRMLDVASRLLEE